MFLSNHIILRNINMSLHAQNDCVESFFLNINFYLIFASKNFFLHFLE